MIAFQVRRTRRMAVRLKELTLSEAMAVCRVQAPEAALSEFLRFTAAEASRPTEQHVTDPRLWTVQERNRQWWQAPPPTPHRQWRDRRV